MKIGSRPSRRIAVLGRRWMHQGCVALSHGSPRFRKFSAIELAQGFIRP